VYRQPSLNRWYRSAADATPQPIVEAIVVRWHGTRSRRELRNRAPRAEPTATSSGSRARAWLSRTDTKVSSIPLSNGSAVAGMENQIDQAFTFAPPTWDEYEGVLGYTRFSWARYQRPMDWAPRVWFHDGRKMIRVRSSKCRRAIRGR
jgi:hypothetical protein